MFKAEEAVVARERVTLPPLEYCDNAKCLQLLEDAPHGIFHLLDTCCRVHATPASFTLQLHERHLPTSEFLVPTINGFNEDRRFTVRHFAGDVTYTSSTLWPRTRRRWRRRRGRCYRRGFASSAPSSTSSASPPPCGGGGAAAGLNGGNGRGGAGRGGGGGAWAAAAAAVSAPGRVATSTGRRFLRDMSRLMAQLSASASHFVHCVKPNGLEQPELLSYEMVAEQLTSLGTLETVQLMGLGYPVRLRYEQIRQRYLPRLSGIAGSSLLSPKLFAEMIMEVCELPPGDFKLGVTRLFLRHRAAQVLESLEPLDSSSLEPLVTSKVSAFWAAASRIASHLILYHRRRKFRAFWHGVLVAQKYLRMWICQIRYQRTLLMATRIQHAYRTLGSHGLPAPQGAARRGGAPSVQGARHGPRGRAQRARAARRRSSAHRSRHRPRRRPADEDSILAAAGPSSRGGSRGSGGRRSGEASPTRRISCCANSAQSRSAGGGGGGGGAGGGRSSAAPRVAAAAAAAAPRLARRRRARCSRPRSATRSWRPRSTRRSRRQPPPPPPPPPPQPQRSIFNLLAS